MNTTVKLLVPLSTLAVAAAVVVGSGATWTSTTQSAITATAGTLVQANSQNGATLAVANLEPGSTQTGTLTITNTGNLDGTLKLLGSSTLDEFLVAGDVTLTIEALGGVLYQGDFGDIAAATDPDGAGPATAGVQTWTSATLLPTDAVTFTFTVEMATDAGHGNQGKQANADLQFVLTQTGADDSEQSGWDSPVGTPSGTPSTIIP